MAVNSSNLSFGTKNQADKAFQQNETLRQRFSFAPKQVKPFMHQGQQLSFSKPVLKNKSDRWYLQWTIIYPGGIHVRQKRSFGINRGKSKREKIKLAQQAIKNFKPENYLTNIKPVEKSVIEHDTIAQYLKHHKAFWKKKTYGTYKTKLKIFSSWLQDKKIDPKKLNSRQAFSFIEYLIVKRKSSHTTCNAYRATLWQMFAFWPETKKQNPFDGIKNFPDSKIGKKAFSSEQRNLLIDHVRLEDPYLFTFICFMHYCFLRPDEIRNLKISNIDWTQQTIQLPYTNSKTNRNRIHAIPPVFFGHLKYLRQYDPANYVFGQQLTPSKKPVGESFWSRRMIRILKGYKFNTNFSLYSWRHTAAVELYKKHKDIRLVQLAMQHTTVNTTERYLRSLGVLEDVRLFDRDPL